MAQYPWFSLFFSFLTLAYQNPLPLPASSLQLTELDSLLGLTTTDNTQIRYDLHTNSLHVPSVGDLSAGPHSLNVLLSAISANQEGQSIQELSEIEVCRHGVLGLFAIAELLYL